MIYDITIYLAVLVASGLSSSATVYPKLWLWPLTTDQCQCVSDVVVMTWSKWDNIIICGQKKWQISVVCCWAGLGRAGLGGHNQITAIQSDNCSLLICCAGPRPGHQLTGGPHTATSHIKVSTQFCGTRYLAKVPTNTFIFKNQRHFLKLMGGLVSKEKALIGPLLAVSAYCQNYHEMVWHLY